MEDSNNVTLLRLLFHCSHVLHMSQKHPGQGRLLILLLENGTLTQRRLIEITGRRSATLSEQLENMESAGYITRKKNDSDKRNVDVTLTPFGQKAAEDAIAARAQLADSSFNGFTEDEMKDLYMLLKKLSSKLDLMTSEIKE